MKHGPVTKLDKRNKKPIKMTTMTQCQKIVTSLSFHYHFIANLEQSGSQIRDAVTLIFSLIVAFYPTKITNRTKKSATQLSQYCFE